LEHHDDNVRVFVIWEPVLATDWSSPSSITMKRISDSRVQQYWDQSRLSSKAMGEHDRSSVVWDRVFVYSGEAVWEGSPPEPLFKDGPVIRVVPAFENAVQRATAANR